MDEFEKGGVCNNLKMSNPDKIYGLDQWCDS